MQAKGLYPAEYRIFRLLSTESEYWVRGVKKITIICMFLCMFVSLYGLLATHRLRTSVLSYSVFRPGCKPSFDLTNIYGNAFEWHLVLNTVFKKLLNVITIIIAPKSSGCLSLCMPSLNWSAGGGGEAEPITMKNKQWRQQNNERRTHYFCDKKYFYNLLNLLFCLQFCALK